MPTPTSKTPQRIERMVAMHEAGASAREVAEEIGVSHSTVNGWLKDAGLEPNGGLGDRKRRERTAPGGAAAAMLKAQKAIAELTTAPTPGQTTDTIAELQDSLALINGVTRYYEQEIRKGTADIGQLDKAMAVKKRLLTEIKELTPRVPMDPEKDLGNVEAAAETRQRFASLVEAAERQQRNGVQR
jgi:Homeodomain-like domain